MNHEELVRGTTVEVRSRMDKQFADHGAGHGFDHIERVLKSARLIQAEVGGDLLTVELAALLHDIGDAKFHQGEERSGEFSKEILSGLRAPDELIEHVVEIVDNISFRRRALAVPLSLEGQIVQDADRLDAFGAIGIVRTIEFGAVRNQPFHLPSGQPGKTGIDHFHEKLFKLRDLMNTEMGRSLAVQREEFMRSFIEQFLAECQ